MDKRLMAALFGALLAVPTACSKEVYYDYEDPQVMLFEVSRILPGMNCPMGGQAVSFGLDTSRNGQLEPSEITNTEYVCDGENGKVSYVVVTEIVSGKVCPYGGQQIDIGIDLNKDKKLSEDEIQSTHYVCFDSRSETWSEMSGLDSIGNYTCGHLKNQGVACWGVAVDGSEETSAPTIINGISKAEKMSAGCIVARDGTVECWSGIDESPRKVPNILNAIDVTGNQSAHACAVLEDKTAVCWGSNDHGQLGNGSTTSSSTPVGVFELGGTRLKDVHSIKAGPTHTCAIVGNSRKVACWGNNETRQLGNAVSTARSVGAVYIQDIYGTDITGVSQVALGDGHTCVLFEKDGKVKCWGNNDSGQLGSTRTMGSVVSDLTTVSIGGTEVTGAKGVYCGGTFSCIRAADSSVLCFGDNTYNQLGARTKGLQSGKPVTVVKAEDGSNLDKVVSMSLGRYHGCALLEDSSVYCWGREARGQLGNAKIRDFERYSTLPVKFDGYAGGASDTLALGSNHGCQLNADKTVSCWGLNNAGQMGEENGNSWLFSASPLPVVELTGAASVVSGPVASHSCAVLEDKTLSCWGSNGSGQLGDGEPTVWKTPLQVLKYKADGTIEDVPLSSVTAVSTGSAHTCAIISTDAMSGKTRVDCWGAGASGQTGNASFEDTLLPTEVPGSADLKFSAIASGSEFNCAVAAGTVRCWGEGADGQLGNNSTNKSASLVQASGLTTVSKIAAGHAHACALNQSGTMRCWGNNAYGQLGDGSTDSRKIPTAISGFDTNNVTDIAVGHFHTCAIVKSDPGSAKEANVWCWGNNAYGQLGSGNRNNSSVPVKVRGLPASAASISCGAGHTCAVLTTGEAWCWGRNEYGQIGRTAGQLGAVPGALMP